MTERRRPAPGRVPRTPRKTAQSTEPNPYRDSGDAPAAVKTAPKPVDDAVVKKPRGRPKKAAAETVVVSEAPAKKRAAASKAPATSAPAAVVAPPAPPPTVAPVAPPAPRIESAPSDTAANGGSDRAPYAGDRAPDRGPDRNQDRGDRNADRNGDRNADRSGGRGRFQRRRGRGRNRFRDGVAEGGETAAPPQAHQPRNDRGPRPERHNNDRPPRHERQDRGPRPERGERVNNDRQDRAVETPGSNVVVAEAEITGWYDPARGDGGFIRRGSASYLPQPGDPFIPGWMARQFQLRRADLIQASWGHDQRRRPTVCEIATINDAAPDPNVRRKDFKSLTASYPDKRLTLETGRPAKVGPEITRRAIDLIAPIGYGQRALIVAPARAGKTTLLQAITEGVHLNHPDAVLMLLLVDERPEEVSEAISWDVGEVIASSFDQPAQRHVDVTEIVTERAHRLVEMGKDVVIVLDSITRMGRAFNTANRGTGRTMSGGLDANAMAKPKAFFGSARNVSPEDGGGSLTIIATALVETGSRMDDVIFEEFKGTGNCEIKLDRGLAERRIYPAIDIPASGTRREEKLYKPEQVQSIYMLRRGLQQMPPMGAMEWLIKRISATANNDALLAGL
jgi:transcription termination factor Rho